MNRDGADIVYRKLRAPKGNGEALIDPPLAEFPAIVQDARNRLGESQSIVGRQTLSALRKQARVELTHLLGTPFDSSQPIIASGHQPELFHPGVWFKNWLLNVAARSVGATPINFVIDNDLATAISIRAPIHQGKELTTKAVACDRGAAEMPWEERPILEHDLFASFGDRLASAMRPIVADPLVAKLWPYAIEEAKHSDRLGWVLAKARHRLEKSLGITNYELPLSEICKTATFARFAAAILIQLPRFQNIYNAALHEYRRVHGLRSETHPAPDLVNQNERMESPFWLWSKEKPTRRPMMVTKSSAGFLLTNEAGVKVGPLPTVDFEAIVSQLEKVQSRGIKIRPRALATTMFLRLAVCDLFIHGIGGAKYDQATDIIAERFFGVKPAPYATATATLQLPGASDICDPAADIRRRQKKLRDMTFNPQRYISNEDAAGLIAERKSWVEQSPPKGHGKQRQMEIARLNRELQPFVAQLREQTETELSELQRQRRSFQLATSREFSFALFSEGYISATYESMLHHR